MVSNSMLLKIAKMREAAPHELPKARLCAFVVLSSVEPLGEGVAAQAIADLKAALGSNWSATTAFQYMSGRQAEFATECGTRAEQPSLFLAHLIAKEVASLGGFSGAARPDGIDLAKLRALVEARHSGAGQPKITDDH